MSIAQLQELLKAYAEMPPSLVVALVASTAIWRSAAASSAGRSARTDGALRECFRFPREPRRSAQFC